MSQPNKTSNRLRIAVCVLYVAQIFFLSDNYSYITDETGEFIKGQLSCFSLIYSSVSVGNLGLSVCSILMALIPIAGFLIFAFDRKTNIKSIYGVFSSIVAVFLIFASIGGLIGFGSTMAIILYIPIVFLSVMGMFSKIAVSK